MLTAALLHKTVSFAAVLLIVLTLASCGSADKEVAKPAESSAPRTIQHAKQEDFSRFMPLENRVSAKLVDGPLLGVAQLPGGTLADYKKGAKAFQQFLFKAPSVAMTPVYLGHCKDAMTNPKFVASFGGYYGEIQGKPVFVFVKNEYVAGLIGLSLEDADAQGRVAATRIP